MACSEVKVCVVVELLAEVVSRFEDESVSHLVARKVVAYFVTRKVMVHFN